MAYSNIIQAPVKFITKMPRKDFIVLVVVICLIIAGIAGVIVHKNRKEIAESFSNLSKEVAKACGSYPEIVSDGVYAAKNCECLECMHAEYAAPPVDKPACECPIKPCEKA